MIGKRARRRNRTWTPRSARVRTSSAAKRYVIDVPGYDPDNVIHLEDPARRRMVKVFGSPGATPSRAMAGHPVLPSSVRSIW